MSTAPSRTRSLRKPPAGTVQHEISTAATPSESSTRVRGNQSPSRLPKPPSFSALPSSISRPGTSGSNASTRPTPRTGISRPPLTSNNKTLSHRSGARTPTESSSSLQRAPSTRHARNSSTSALPALPRPPSVTQTRSRTAATANTLPTTASTTLRPPSSASQTSTSAQEPGTKPSHHRPAFSTLQQHFSPLKNPAPKPATASFLAPPSPSKHPSAIAASAETSRLQAELLQLHLLHRDSATVTVQYRQSAKRKLGSRFEAVRAKHSDLAAAEAKERERGNLLALREWDTGTVGWGLEERLQVLDAVLSGVWKMGEPGGRYLRVVKRFDRWASRVWDILEERKADTRGLWGYDGDGDSDGAEEALFVRELDGEWKEECRVLARKLEGWRDQLVDLGLETKSMSKSRSQDKSTTRTSSLATVVNGVRDLVAGMLEEVQVMERVERDVIAREEQWIKDILNDESEEQKEEEDTTSRVAGAVWRTV